LGAGTPGQRLPRFKGGSRETGQIYLAVRGLETIPHELRIADAVVTADMFLYLAVIAEKAIGEGFLGGELDGVAAGASGCHSVDRVTDERSLQRRCAIAPERSQVRQNLVYEERLLPRSRNDGSN
jgi:hypothetical protein